MTDVEQLLAEADQFMAEREACRTPLVRVDWNVLRRATDLVPQIAAALRKTLIENRVLRDEYDHPAVRADRDLQIADLQTENEQLREELAAATRLLYRINDVPSDAVPADLRSGIDEFKHFHHQRRLRRARAQGLTTGVGGDAS